MTAKKHVAKTLLNVLEHPVMSAIMDRHIVLNDIIQDVQDYWTFDMYTRKPGAALRDGIFVGTDLDLACFMCALADRGAVINIPHYKSMRPKTIKEGQRVVSKENRHGPIVNLNSNKDLFSFSVRIKDANVVTTDDVGDYRNFSLTDPSGDWYQGWSTIQFDPVAKENKFLTENDIWTGNRVVFKNFVHPNRWISFYGHHYFITKALIARMEEQAKNMHGQMKKMMDDGITFPIKGEGAKKVWPKSHKEEGKSVKFRALEVEVDVPEYANDYETLPSTQENLVYLDKTRNEWNYKILPNLRFAVRATELAYFKFGEGRMPAWLKNVNWEDGFKLPGKRIMWDRLKLVQPGVGEFSVSIRKRVKEKSEIMNKDYNGGI